MNADVAAGPKILRISVFVVPPSICNAIKLERRIIAIVLIFKIKKIVSRLFTMQTYSNVALDILEWTDGIQRTDLPMLSFVYWSRYS